MYSPAPYFIEREVVTPHYVGEYYLEKDSEVSLCLLPNNYDHNNYNNPFEFNPERWKTEKPDPF